MKQFDLDTPLIEFTGTEKSSFFRIRHACQGVAIFGGIGSGKTSGSGKCLALKYLKHGFGGLVLTAKGTETDLWIEYCRLAGRLDDLIVIEPGGNHFFNFLEFVSSNIDKHKTITSNIADVLKTVIQAGSSQQAGKGGDNQFWEDALTMLISNTISLCLLAFGKVSVQAIYDIVQTLPKTSENPFATPPPDDSNSPFRKAYKAAADKIRIQVDAWEKNLPEGMLETIIDEGRYDVAMERALPDARAMHLIDQFFVVTYINLSEKTRSIIDLSFSGFLFNLLQEPVYSLFCDNPSTITPNDCLDGKIIVINLPVKEYYKAGRDCQIMMKYIAQRAWESRNVKENNRPLFLWSDEGQLFLHQNDTESQATARSSLIRTVILTQNLPNIFASMGGDHSENRVKALLSTLSTQIFHSNAMETNRYASDMFGEAYQEEISRNVTLAPTYQASESTSYKLAKLVRPEEFASLLCGGPLNNHIVTAYIHRQGETFDNGLNFKLVQFKQ